MLRDSDTRRFVSALAVGSICFVVALGLFLFVRRATGALASPLAASQLVITAIVMCGWALVVREISHKRPILSWVALATMLLVAIACSFPAARALDWLVWLPAFGIVSLLPVALNRIEWRPHQGLLKVLKDEGVPEQAEQVLQQLTRVRTSEGTEAVRGTLTAEFALGERQTTLYVGFCPPFELLPEVEANATGDFEADIKLVQVLHNGAQFEVRLSEPAEEPLTASIEFFASEGV